MFMGHYSAALVARRAAPALPLAVYFVACQFIDLLWGCLVLLDVEKLRVVPHFTATNNLDLYFMPYTHGLPAALLWSFAAALAFWLWAPATFPQRGRTALVLAAAVLSHWLLDLVVHLHDLPLWLDRDKVGLGLWNHRTPALLLELLLVWGGILVAARGAGARRTRYLVLGLAMSVVQVLSLVLEPPLPLQVASHLLLTYLLLSAAALWVGQPQRTARPQPA